MLFDDNDWSQHSSLPSEGYREEDLLRLIDLCPFLATEKSQYDNAAVLTLLTHNPAAACLRHSYRCGIGNATRAHPLALVVALGGSLEVVTIMVNACPEALVEKLSGRRNVLHYAIAEGADISIVRYLTLHNPRLVVEEDSFRAVPLHLASTYYPSSSSDVVRHLLCLHPYGAQSIDYRSQTPLHRACRSRVSLEKILCLIEAFPDAIFKKDWLRTTPLEYAESTHQRLSEPCQDVIEILGMVEDIMRIGNAIDQEEDAMDCCRCFPSSCLGRLDDWSGVACMSVRARRILSHFRAIQWRGGIRLAFGRNSKLALMLNLPVGVYPRLLSLLDADSVEGLYSMLVQCPDIVSVNLHHKY